MTERAIQRLQQQWQKADDLAVDSALVGLLQSYEGRKYLWWLLRIGKVGLQPFTSNALNTSFACGELNVGQQILDHIMSVNPAGYVAMMTENANERSSRDSELRSAAGGNGADEFDQRAGGEDG